MSHQWVIAVSAFTGIYNNGNAQEPHMETDGQIIIMEEKRSTKLQTSLVNVLLEKHMIQ